MADLIAVIGESGSGKSTSLRNLNPDETFIISVTNKPLPFRGWKKLYTKVRKEGDKWVGNYYLAPSYEGILKMLKLVNKMMPHIKNVVIDDMQYVMSFEFVERATEVGYTKFTEMAQHIMEIIRFAESMREDIKLICLTHSENKGDVLNPKYSMKTIGKLLDEKVTLEGLFTYVFFTTVAEGDSGKQEYKFLTNSNGECVAKTPMGMFEELEIDNDMNEIIKVIDEYNNGDDI